MILKKDMRSGNGWMNASLTPLAANSAAWLIKVTAMERPVFWISKMQKENWKNAVVIPWKNFFAAAMQDIFGRQLKSVIRNTASIRIGRICMLKIRLQGTTNDIKWFKKILERDKRINVLDVSEPYANKGTKKYFRVYAEVEKNRQ